MIGAHLTKPNEPRTFSALAALACASRRTHWEFIHLLHRTDAVNPRGSIALLWGAATGNIKPMERAVGYGADVSWVDHVGDVNPDPRKMTAGHRITGYDLRGDPKRTPKRYGTALHFAVKMGQDKAVKWLLDHGARHDIPSRDLCHCCERGRNQWQAWRVVARYPPWYPLHMAICYDRLSTFRLLVSSGASLTKLYQARSTALRVYPTALQSAAYAGNWDIFSYILGQPGEKHWLEANIQRRGLYGRGRFYTTLINIVYMGSGLGNRGSRAQIIRDLVRRGGMPEAEFGVPGIKQSVLFRACKGEAFGIAYDLIEFKAVNWALYQRSSTKMCYYVLKAPEDLRYPRIDDDDDAYSDYYDENPEAQQRDRLELARLFVREKSVDINQIWYTEKTFGETAAMLAARPTNTAEGAVEALKFIKELGADLKTVNPSGMNALHYLVKQLTSPKADGMPRDVAFTSSSTIEHLLQDAGLELNFRDVEGNTALDYLYNAVKAITAKQPRLEHILNRWNELTVHLAEAMLLHSRVSHQSPWFLFEAARLGTARQALEA